MTSKLLSQAIGLSGTTGNSTNITVSSNGSLQLAANGGTDIFISANDNIGIGTSSPSRKLEVNGSILSNGELYSNSLFISLSSNSSPVGGAGGQISLNNLDTSNTSASVILFRGVDENNNLRHSGAISVIKESQWLVSNGFPAYMSFWTRPSGGDEQERLRISSNGNVGIGTSIPGSSLHVAGAAVGDGNGGNGVHIGVQSGYATIEMVGTNTTGSLIDFSVGNTDYKARIIHINSNNHLYVEYAGGYRLHFGNNGSITTTANNFGIGNSTPSAALTVYNASFDINNGIGQFTNPLANTQYNFLLVGKAASAYNSGLFGFYNANNANSFAWMGVWGAGVGTNTLNMDAAGNLTLGTPTVAGYNTKITVRQDGTGASWYGRIVTQNNTSDRSVFLGTYGNNAVVAAHNFALNGWQRLYLNTTNAADGTDIVLGGGGKIGVSTESPTAKFHVVDVENRDNTGYITAENTNTGTAGATNAQILVKSKYGYSQLMQWESFGVRIGSRLRSNSSSGNVYFTAGDDNVSMTIAAAGQVLTPYQPAFHGYITSTWPSSGYITGWSTSVNRGNHFNASTGTFTAPIAGAYVFFFSSIGYNNQSEDIYTYINGSKRAEVLSVRPQATTSTTYAPLSSSTGMIILAAGDYVNIWTSGAIYSDSNVWLRFGGYLLG